MNRNPDHSRLVSVFSALNRVEVYRLAVVLPAAILILLILRGKEFIAAIGPGNATLVFVCLFLEWIVALFLYALSQRHAQVRA